MLKNSFLFLTKKISSQKHLPNKLKVSFFGENFPFLRYCLYKQLKKTAEKMAKRKRKNISYKNTYSYQMT